MKHLDFILWDVICLQIAFILAYNIRQGFFSFPYESRTYSALGILLFVLDFLMAVMFNTMHNVMKRGIYQEFVQTIKQVLLVLAFMLIFMFAMRGADSLSRITIFLTAILHFAIGICVRLLWKKHVRACHKKRKNKRPKSTMVVVADEDLVESLLSDMSPFGDFDITGIVLTGRDGEGEIIAGIPVVGSMTNAAQYICREWVDEVFVCTDAIGAIRTADGGIEPELESGSVAKLIEQCSEMSVPIHICLPISVAGGKRIVEKVGGISVLTATANYASPLQMLIKRAMDIVGGLLGSLAALLIMLFVGPRIKKASPGPILFTQERIGENGKRFKIYKMRSMYLDAEERKKELLKQNKISDGMMFKMDFDPRIIGNEILPDGTRKTGIGEFIRSTSLDEFPQFFNVLKGEMSLVGTRPPTVDEWEKYEFHHRARLGIKPGLTGMWQVSGRSGITDFEEVVKLDTEYINEWSVGLDLKILLKTVKSVVKKDGAM